MLMMIFKEILKASCNNQASIFAFTFKIKYYTKLNCLCTVTSMLVLLWIEMSLIVA